MFNISNYLSKFAQFTPPDDSLKRYVSELLESELHFVVDKKDIKVQNKSIYITAPPIVKNEIFLRRNYFLEKIKEVSKDKIIENIQ